MIIEQTLERLSAMKLFGMSRSVKDRLARPDHKDLSVTDFLGLVVDDEWLHRDNKKREMREKGAKFKNKQATIESIDYTGHARGITKSQVLEFAQLHWLRKKQNIAITGLTGVGKSWLAQALGSQACREGLRVLFLREPMLIHALLTAKATGGLPALLKRWAKIELLIIDDLGTATLSEESRRDLLELVEERNGVGSTIITSQLPVNEWHDHFGSGRVADAICDRLVRNAHRVALIGETRRAKVETLDPKD